MSIARDDPRALLGERLTAAKATPAQRELAWVVLSFADRASGTGARPSRATLARCTGRSPRSVFTDLQALVTAGILTAHPRAGEPTVYDVAGWRVPAETAAPTVLDPRAGELLATVEAAVPGRLWATVHAPTLRAECSRLAELGWTAETLGAAAKAKDWAGIQTGGGVIAWARDRSTPPRPRQTITWCGSCVRGWLPDEGGEASERPCPTCRPHRISTVGAMTDSAPAVGSETPERGQRPLCGPVRPASALTQTGKVDDLSAAERSSPSQQRGLWPRLEPSTELPSSARSRSSDQDQVIDLPPGEAAARVVALRDTVRRRRNHTREEGITESVLPAN